MWYWTIPSLVLTGACLFIPTYVHAITNWIDTRHVHRRNHDLDDRDYYNYMRDRRITGSEYKQRGLEGLDKEVDLSGLNSLIFGRERMAIPQKP